MTSPINLSTNRHRNLCSSLDVGHELLYYRPDIDSSIYKCLIDTPYPRTSSISIPTNSFAVPSPTMERPRPPCSSTPSSPQRICSMYVVTSPCPRPTNTSRSSTVQVPQRLRLILQLIEHIYIAVIIELLLIIAYKSIFKISFI